MTTSPVPFPSPYDGRPTAHRRMVDGYLEELSFPVWRSRFRKIWKQGEHVVLMGQTGAGKTTLARDILDIRRYVVVIAVKRHDDTLSSFKPQYSLIRQWPPGYNQERVIMWIRPKDLLDIDSQREKVYNVLNNIFHVGGWCAFLDDTSFIASSAGLGLRRPVVVLLNQARSSYVSVVTAATQPTSVVASIPTESFRQTRHQLIFGYYNEKDVKAISEIVGYPLRQLQGWMELLGAHDFLAFSHGKPVLVRR